MSETHGLYGLIAEFDSPDVLLAAARRTYAAGFRKLDAFSPFPIEGLSEALEVKDNRVALFTLLGGLFGCAGGFGMQYYAAVINYPFNIGGRPLNSWPAFVPVTFELTVLCASFGALISLLWLNGFPKPYHPVFNAPRFNLATFNRFFLCIKARDPNFDVVRTREFLESLQPKEVADVPL